MDWEGGWGGCRLWPQAEGLITVLAKEQKAEGAGGMEGDGEGEGEDRGTSGPD